MNWIKKCVLISLPLSIAVSCINSNDSFDASGNFEAIEVIVSSEATGRIQEFNIDEGSQVLTGQQVGCVDSVQLCLQKERLLANIAAINNRKLDIPTQLAAFDQQIDYLEKEKLRAERLVAAGVGNTKTLDDINSQLRTLQKQREAQLSSMKNGNISLENEISGLMAQLKQLNDQIERCRIASPITGTVIGKYIEKGEITVTGKPLFKVANLDTMILKAYITQNQLTKLKLNDSVRVFTDYDDGARKEYGGKIIWISDEAEFTPKTIQTKEERKNFVYAIKVQVKNDGYLKIGMYGELEFLNKVD